MMPLGVCFAGGALILTRDGPVPIETLDVGERVWTTVSARPRAG
ncbi:MAG: Hint domain-containing protein [Planctomycetota bacterium]